MRRKLRGGKPSLAGWAWAPADRRRTDTANAKSRCNEIGIMTYPFVFDAEIGFSVNYPEEEEHPQNYT